MGALTWDDIDAYNSESGNTEDGSASGSGDKLTWNEIDTYEKERVTSVPDYDTREKERLTKRRDELQVSMAGAGRMNPDSDALTEWESVNKELEWQNSSKADDKGRAFVGLKGERLEDGMSYADGKGEFFRFNYDAFKRGEDPRTPITPGEYAREHHAEELDEEDVAVNGAEAVKWYTEDRRQRNKESADGASALGYFEKKHGQAKGRMTIPAEYLMADDHAAAEDTEGQAAIERVSKHTGGTIDHRALPMHFVRGEDGKVIGFKTSGGTIVEELDGSFSVIPTVTGEQGHTREMTDEEAAQHYRKTEYADTKHSVGEKVGERFGNFKTRAEAEQALNDIDTAHSALYANKWNQYMREHWDEISDGEKVDPARRDDYKAWVSAGKPRAQIDVEAARKARAAHAPTEQKGERGIAEDIQQSYQQETGDANVSAGRAAAMYMLPGGMGVARSQSAEKQDRYERYLNGETRAEDLALDSDLATITQGLGKEEKASVAKQYGYDMLKEMQANKDAASKFLATTDLPWYKVPVAGGVKNLGYTGMYALSAMGGGLLGSAAKSIAEIAIPALAAGQDRYNELSRNAYAIDDEGNLTIDQFADSSFGAAAKALVGGVAEAVIEKYLDAGAGKVGKMLAKNGFIGKSVLAKDRFVRKARGYIMEQMAKKPDGVLPNVVRGLGYAAHGFGKAAEVTGVQGLHWEILEEDAQAIVDDVFGLNSRTDSGKGFINGQSLKEAWSDSSQLTWGGQLDVLLNMVGTMVVQGAVGAAISHAANKASPKVHEQLKSVYDIPDIDKTLFDKMNDRQRLSFLRLYNQFSADPKKLERAAQRLYGVDGVLSRALLQAAQRQNIEMARSLEERGIAPEKFEVPVNADGTGIQFTPQTIKLPYGKTSYVGKAAVDNTHGIAIVDQGNGDYLTLDLRTGKGKCFSNPQSAITYGDTLVIEGQKRDADNSVKVQYLQSLASGRGLTVVPYTNPQQFVAAFSGREGAQEGAQNLVARGAPMVRIGDKLHVLLTNVQSPAAMERAFVETTRGMKQTEAGWQVPAPGEIEVAPVPEEMLKRTEPAQTPSAAPTPSAEAPEETAPTDDFGDETAVFATEETAPQTDAETAPTETPEVDAEDETADEVNDFGDEETAFAGGGVVYYPTERNPSAATAKPAEPVMPTKAEAPKKSEPTPTKAETETVKPKTEQKPENAQTGDDLFSMPVAPTTPVATKTTTPTTSTSKKTSEVVPQKPKDGIPVIDSDDPPTKKAKINGRTVTLPKANVGDKVRTRDGAVYQVVRIKGSQNTKWMCVQTKPFKGNPGIKLRTRMTDDAVKNFPDSGEVIIETHGTLQPGQEWVATKVRPHGVEMRPVDTKETAAQKGVQVPNLSGTRDARLANYKSYLEDPNHTVTSLTKAIKDVEKAFLDSVGVKFDFDYVHTVRQMLKAAKARIPVVRAEQKKRNAERMSKLADTRSMFGANLEKYLSDENGGGSELLAYLDLDVGPGEPLHLFNWGGGGSEWDSINNFFNGMKGREKKFWNRWVFGWEDPQNHKMHGGNDYRLQELQERFGEDLTYDDFLGMFAEEVGKYLDWLKNGAVTAEEEYYRDQEEKIAKDEAQSDTEKTNAHAEYDADRWSENDTNVVMYDGTAYRIDHVDENNITFTDKDSQQTYDIRWNENDGSVIMPDGTALYFVARDDGNIEVTDRDNGETFVVRTDDPSYEEVFDDNGREKETRAARDENLETPNGETEERRGSGLRRSADAGQRGTDSLNGSEPGNSAGLTPRALGAKNQENKSAYIALINPKGANADTVATLNARLVAGKPVSLIDPDFFKRDDAPYVPIKGLVINTAKDAAVLFQNLFYDPGVEHSKVLYLDTNGRVLSYRLVGTGAAGCTSTGTREVLNHIPDGCTKIIYSHNHPSGNAKPSRIDNSVTKGLMREIYVKLGIAFDHIITDTNQFYSYNDGHITLDEIVPNNGARIVPYDKRVVANDPSIQGICRTLSSAMDGETSWVVGISAMNEIIGVIAVPKDGNCKGLIKQLVGARKFAVGVGTNGLNARNLLADIDDTLGLNRNKLPDGKINYIYRNGKIAAFKNSQDDMARAILCGWEFFDNLASIPGVHFTRSGDTVWLHGYDKKKVNKADLTKYGFKWGSRKIGGKWVGVNAYGIPYSFIPQDTVLLNNIDESEGATDRALEADAKAYNERTSKTAEERAAEKQAADEKVAEQRRASYKQTQEQIDADNDALDDLDLDKLAETNEDISPVWEGGIGGIYTGSAADYEKPSLIHVGTGEGGQVYGYGLYGTKKRGIAEHYSKIARDNKHRRSFGRNYDVYIDGKNVDLDEEVIKELEGYKDTLEGYGEDAANDYFDYEINDLKGIIESGLDPDDLEFGVEQKLNEEKLESYRKRLAATIKAKEIHEKGNYELRDRISEYIYSQTFFTNRAPGDESHLLNWYEPVSEENVDRIIGLLSKEGILPKITFRTGGEQKYILAGGSSFTLSDLLNTSENDVSYIDNATFDTRDMSRSDLIGLNGGKVYEKLVDILGSYVDASKFLVRADIDGVKYPAGSYGPKKVNDGNKVGWNYVSFRDDNIRVDHKWVDGEQLFEELEDILDTEEVPSTDILLPFDNPKSAIVDNPELIKLLNDSTKIRVFRAAQIAPDDTIHSPMAGKIEGSWGPEIKLGKWERAVERQDLAFEKVKGSGNWYFVLNKGNGNSVTARFDPYIHSSRTPLNDQFKEAYKRPNMVTIESEVPLIDIESGYHADKAYKSVGEGAWPSGYVANRLKKMGKPRQVILSRYDRPLRIVPDSEVADRIAEVLSGTKIKIPWNVVTPSLRAELEKRDVSILDDGKLHETNREIDRPTTLLDKVFAVGIRRASNFLANGIGTKFADFVRYADETFGDKADKLRKFYPSWYTEASIDMPEDIRAQMDDSITVDRMAREMFGLPPRGVDKIGARVPYVVQEHLIPNVPQTVNAASYKGGLDEGQRLGVNLALNAVSQPNGSFMLADGTGFGKTRQLLAIADQYRAENPGARILIITKNQGIIADSFTNDSKAMGIDLGAFTIGTYDGLRAGKFVTGETDLFGKKKWDLVLLDEAHLLSNATSGRSMAFNNMDVDHVVFATATPMDRPTDAAYFMSRLVGIPKEDIARSMGYVISTTKDSDGNMREVFVPNMGMDMESIQRAIVMERDKAIASGKMIRRAYPFLGEIDTNHSVPMRDAHRKNEDNIVTFFDNQIASLRNAKRIYLRGMYRQPGKLFFKGAVPKGQRGIAVEPDKWNGIVEQKRHELLNDKIRAVDDVNENEKALAASEMARNILAENPNARIIICGTQVGNRVIKGGFDGNKNALELNGYTRGVVNNSVEYVIPPSLGVVDSKLNTLGFTNIAHIFTGYDKVQEQRDFVSGKKNILLMTDKSGGTGVNLDDTTGEHPTYLIVLSPNYSAKEIDQLMGRISRKNTKSLSQVYFLTNGSYSDRHRAGVTSKKLAVLKAIQGGADRDALDEMDASNARFAETNEDIMCASGVKRIFGTDITEDKLFEENEEIVHTYASAIDMADSLMAAAVVANPEITSRKIEQARTERARINDAINGNVAAQAAIYNDFNGRKFNAILFGFARRHGISLSPSDIDDITSTVWFGDKSARNDETKSTSDYELYARDGIFTDWRNGKVDKYRQYALSTIIGKKIEWFFKDRYRRMDPDTDNPNRDVSLELDDVATGGKIDMVTRSAFDDRNFEAKRQREQLRARRELLRLRACLNKRDQAIIDYLVRASQDVEDAYIYTKPDNPVIAQAAKESGWTPRVFTRLFADLVKRIRSGEYLSSSYEDTLELSAEVSPSMLMDMMREEGLYDMADCVEMCERGYSNRRIAEKLEMDEHAVSTQLGRARKEWGYVPELSLIENREVQGEFDFGDFVLPPRTKTFASRTRTARTVTPSAFTQGSLFDTAQQETVAPAKVNYNDMLAYAVQASKDGKSSDAIVAEIGTKWPTASQKLVEMAVARAVQKELVPTQTTEPSTREVLEQSDRIKKDALRFIKDNKFELTSANTLLNAVQAKWPNIPAERVKLCVTRALNELTTGNAMRHTPENANLDKMLESIREQYVNDRFTDGFEYVPPTGDTLFETNQEIVHDVQNKLVDEKEFRLIREDVLGNVRNVGSGNMGQDAVQPGGESSLGGFNGSTDSDGGVYEKSGVQEVDGDARLYEISEDIQSGTLFHNDAVNGWRVRNGFEEQAKRAPITTQDTENALKRELSNAVQARDKIDAMLKSGRFVPTADEQALIGAFIKSVNERYEEGVARRTLAEQNGNAALANEIDRALDPIRADVERIHALNARVGAEWSATGRTRQLAIMDDYSLVNQLRRAENALGAPLNSDQRRAVETLVREIIGKNIELDDERTKELELAVQSLVDAWLKKGVNDVNAAKLTADVSKIEREYAEALRQVSFHRDRLGGVLVNLPNGKKWLNAIMRHYLYTGEAYTDGKPDANKTIGLIARDLADHGVPATEWQIRQMLTDMGKSTTPPQSKLEKDRRDLNSQYLAMQQIAYIMAFNEMPPKTGYNRDEPSLAVRELRRQRAELIKARGLDAKSEDGRLKSGLDRAKTAVRNRIEELNNAIATNTRIEKSARTKNTDAELMALRAELEIAKKAYAEAFPKTAEEELEASVIRTIGALKALENYWKGRLELARAGEFERETKEGPSRDELRVANPAIAEAEARIAALKNEFENLKQTAYPDGTLKEQEAREQARLKTLEDRIVEVENKLRAFENAQTYFDRKQAVAAEGKKDPWMTPAIAAKRAALEESKRKLEEYRRQLADENMQPGAKVLKAIGTFTSGARLLRTALDLGQILIQGGIMSHRHPILGAKAACDSIRAISPKQNQQIEQELKNDLYFEDFIKMGGHAYGGLERAEQFRGMDDALVMKIPGVSHVIRASERSFSNYLNVFALALYKNMVNGAWENAGGPTVEQRRALASAVNTALGYGYEYNGKGNFWPSALLFAPRLVVSGIKMAFGWDVLNNALGIKTKDGKHEYTAPMRKEVAGKIASEQLGGIAIAMAASALIVMLLDEDDDKWTKEWAKRHFIPGARDFLAANHNGARVVYGVQKIARWYNLLGRLAAHAFGVAESNTFRGGEKAVGREIRKLLSPLSSVAWDTVEKKNFDNKDINWKKFVPTDPTDYRAESEKPADERGVSGLLNVLEGLFVPLILADLYAGYRTGGFANMAKHFPTMMIGAQVMYTADDPVKNAVRMGSDLSTAINEAKINGDVQRINELTAFKNDYAEPIAYAKRVKTLETKLNMLVKMEEALAKQIAKGDTSAETASARAQYADGIAELREALKVLRQQAAQAAAGKNWKRRPE